MKNFNKGVVWASKFLTSKGITKIKLPAGGFDPELVTRYIKGGAAVNLGVQSLMRLKNRFDEVGDSSSEGSAPGGGPQPTPSPSPRPSPKPPSASFHTALAPAA
ncbi:hypothetical protein D3C59_09305 [Streptomyces sp. SHP22-7]|nr:hypothetical protein D3C59_09305 [Streptomyces sp. SHP22-7]